MKIPDRGTAETGGVYAEDFRSFVEGVQEYAIFMLDPSGVVVSWNSGAERLKGYTAEEIIGHHFEVFYTRADVANRKPQTELELADSFGRVSDEGWRIRKDGSEFWAKVVITALRDSAGNLRGFTKVTRDMTDQRVAELVLQRCINDKARLEADLGRAHEALKSLSEHLAFRRARRPLSPPEMR